MGRSFDASEVVSTSERQNVGANNMNTKRIVDIAFALAGVVTFFVLRQVLGSAWDYFRLPILQDSIVALPDIVSVGLGVGSFLWLRGNEKTKGFVTEVVIELSKVTWPVKKETLVSGVVVVIMVSIASMILFIFDAAWGSITQKLL